MGRHVGLGALPQSRIQCGSSEGSGHIEAFTLHPTIHYKLRKGFLQLP